MIGLIDMRQPTSSHLTCGVDIPPADSGGTSTPLPAKSNIQRLKVTLTEWLTCHPAMGLLQKDQSLGGSFGSAGSNPAGDDVQTY